MPSSVLLVTPDAAERERLKADLASRGQEVVDVSDADQAQSMKAISDFMVAELPLLILYFLPEQVGARSGIVALDDAAGGMEAAQPFGTYTRNAHLWDRR